MLAGGGSSDIGGVLGGESSHGSNGFLLGVGGGANMAPQILSLSPTPEYFAGKFRGPKKIRPDFMKHEFASRK